MSRTMEIGKARRLVIGVTILVFLVLMCIVAWGVYQYTWPATSGMVTKSLAGRNTETTRYDNVVYYSYTVNGHEYSGQNTNSNRINALAYQEGVPIKVYYSPIIPYLSTIFPGRGLTILVPFFCCIFPFLLFINGILYLPKPKKGPTAQTKGMI